MWSVIAFATAFAAATGPAWMQGAELMAEFSGKTARGAYGNGVEFTEFYGKDGLTDYREPMLALKGRWSVVNGMFCTLYEEVPGGCFRIARESANCYAAYIAAGTEEEARAPKEAERWIARFWITDRPSTCTTGVIS